MPTTTLRNKKWSTMWFGSSKCSGWPTTRMAAKPSLISSPRSMLTSLLVTTISPIKMTIHWNTRKSIKSIRRCSRRRWRPWLWRPATPSSSSTRHSRRRRIARSPWPPSTWRWSPVLAITRRSSWWWKNSNRSTNENADSGHSIYIAVTFCHSSAQ